MPKLWEETIESHRAAVRDATLDATASLVHAHGLAAVTMSQIAKEAGIGRATLYKYFPDVGAVMVAWHERLVEHHLEQLSQVRDGATDPEKRLAAVLSTYALLAYEHRHQGEVAATLHQGAHVGRAQGHLLGLVEDLLSEAAAAGRVRADVAPTELAAYALHALSAAGGLSSKAAAVRLVEVTMAGLRGPPQTSDIATIDSDRAHRDGVETRKMHL